MNKKHAALLVAAVLLLAIGNYVSFKIALKNAIDLVQVPFANKEIYSHYVVEEDDIEFREIPRAYIDENIFTTKDDIVGKYVSIDSKINKGSLFYKNALIEKEVVDTLPGLLLKENQVAFPLSMNLYKSSGNTFQTNQKVDVYVTYTDKKTKITTVDILLTNVRIIGLKDRNGLDMREEKAQKLPSLAILAIDKNYVNLLKLAYELGEVSLLAPRVDYQENEESTINKECLILPLLGYDDI